MPGSHRPCLSARAATARCLRAHAGLMHSSCLPRKALWSWRFAMLPVSKPEGGQMARSLRLDPDLDVLCCAEPSTDP